MSVRIEGLSELRRKLGAVTARMPSKIEAALHREAQKIATKSRRRTPVDTGALRASHHVEAPRRSGRDVSVRIGVGGPAVSYAHRVHEDLEARHTVGEAKFLENSVTEAIPGMAARIGKGLLER